MYVCMYVNICDVRELQRINANGVWVRGIKSEEVGQ